MVRVVANIDSVILVVVHAIAKDNHGLPIKILVVFNLVICGEFSYCIAHDMALSYLLHTLRVWYFSAAITFVGLSELINVPDYRLTPIITV